ncbi:MAG: LamG domain-containing protein [Candidatus Thorarchaeota archaeon]|nr:MAG: hypothetical protein DRP42_02965 [Mycoplasmatota bacterium]HEC71999.1 LamG domain-containing protein [Thermoplasmatales archaeon]
MTWDNPPVKISERGAAIQPRYVYVTSLSKGFLVYNGVRSAQHTLFVKEYPGSTDTWVISADIGIVESFDIGESETNDNVIIVYSNGHSMYKLEVNFATQEVVSGPEFIFVGSHPAFDKQKPPKVDYIKDDDLKHRASVSALSTEYDVGDAPDKLFLQIAADKFFGQDKIRFATQTVPSLNIVLPFSNITETILRYDGQTTLSSPRRLEDLSGNGYHLAIGTLPIHTGYGLRSDGIYESEFTWGLPSTAITIEAKIYRNGNGYESYVVNSNSITFGYMNDGTLIFSFYGGGETHTFKQTYNEDQIKYNDKLAYISVSHTWGSPGSTFMTINGTVVLAEWVEGDGTPFPSTPHWKMNDNAGLPTVIDSSGMHDGSVSGGVTSVSGKINTALSFNGSNGWIDIAHHTGLQPHLFTVSFWLNAASSQSGSHSLAIDKSHGWLGYTGWVFQIKNSTQKMGFAIGNNINGFPQADSTTSILDDVTRHYFGTYDGSNLRLYVNNVLEATIPFSSTSAVWANTRNVNMGSNWGGGSRQRYLNGWIDDVRLYPRVLSSSERAIIYNSGNGTENELPNNVTTKMILGIKDYLYSMRILNVARSSSQIRNYIEGKLL